MGFSHLILIAALWGASDAAATRVSPGLTTLRQSVFAIPYRIDRTADPARQPVEVQLHVSTDRGAHWQLYSKAPPTQQYFMFRAGGDGEYWFAIRTVDRSGQVRPESITGPGLRVRVEAQPPDAKPAAPKPPPHTAARFEVQFGGGSDSGPTRRNEPQGSVAVAIHSAVGSNRAASEGPLLGGEPVETPRAGARPRMVNSRMFELEYDVDAVGPSGIGRVELWGTRDGGRSWRSFGIDADRTSPLLVSVEEEGVYGFRVAVSNGAGMGGKCPVAGDLPDLWVAVDLTKPVAQIVSARQGVDAESGQIVISWQADDKMLAARPISLWFRQDRADPWLPIAGGLENTGRYVWPIDHRTPSSVYLRLEVRDEAGNLGVHETAEPVAIDQSRPTVRIREVRPVRRTGQ